ncbi:hypothetical protein [Nocardia sp. NPDC052566]|uniref:hypothetical protein n=1 Tax=Nocardia sp. NPDC052566 TaxID=3364330 RepID=UPI0037C7061F
MTASRAAERRSPVITRWFPAFAGLTGALTAGMIEALQAGLPAALPNTSDEGRFR